MSEISFKLLSTPMIFMDEEQVILPFKKAEALLYYLAIKKSISREMAATMLWGTDNSQADKKNLRNTIYTIKKVFKEELIISPQKQLLILNPELIVRIDYDELKNNHNYSVYDGAFLQGFKVKNADSFNEWVDMQRIEIKDLYLHELFNCMLHSIDKNLSEAESIFAKYVKEDSLDERVYQLMMECYQKNGLYHKGIKVYRNVSRILNSELRIAPCSEITQLHRKLLSEWNKSSSGEPQQTPLKIIGREQEIQYLMKAYHHFLLGSPSAIMILGDNGVGKTYLVNHFLKSIGEDSCMILKAICFQAEKDYILQPWNTIMLQIDQYIRNRHIVVPESYLIHINTLFPLFGNQNILDQIPDDIMTSYNYRTARNSILKLFSLIGEEIPIILFFDNIQFMDNFSLELLSLIIRLQNPNIFCIITGPDTMTPNLQKHKNALIREKFLKELILQPFTEENVAEIIRSRLGPDTFNDRIINSIYKDSEGNGFFIDLLLKYFTVSGASFIDIPRNPEDLLLERLDEISVAARKLLDTISICPKSISLDIIEYIFNSNTPEIIDLTDELKQHNLISEKICNNQISFMFKHSKMQDFVHSKLSPSKRRLLHSRVANYYETSKNLIHNNIWYQNIITHYAQAGNEIKVLQYKILSLADYSRYNYELYPILQPQKDFDLEAPRQISKYFDELSTELTRLYNYQPNAIDFAELETRLALVIGKYCISQGIYNKGLDAIKISLSHTEYLKTHPQIHISCLRQLTFYGIQRWDTHLMKENIENCIVIEKKYRLNIEYAIECRLYGLYMCMCGKYDDSMEKLKLAIRLFESSSLDSQNYILNTAACYNYMGEVQRKQKNFDKSLEYYEKALEICSDRKYPKNPTFFSNQARALLALGKKNLATNLFFAANKQYDASNILVDRAITKAYCSLLYAEMGEFRESKKLLEEAKLSANKILYPMSLGILELVKANLIKNYPKEFGNEIKESYEDCCKLTKEYLKSIPGAYEIEELQ